LSFSPKAYTRVEPTPALGLAFRPMQTEANYTTWPLVTDLFPSSFPGVQTKQDPLVVDIDREKLIARMRDYFDPAISDTELAQLYAGSMDGTGACEPVSTRRFLVNRGFLPEYLVRFAFRPFDLRWLYWEPETKLLGRPVPDYFRQVDGNRHWIITQRMPRRDWAPPQVIRALGCIDLMDRSASCITAFLKPDETHGGLFGSQAISTDRLVLKQAKALRCSFDTAV
jgi:Type ISP C-terminal specificity domain